jgi:hypothetical protein
MYVRPSAPRTTGGVLDDAISLYRHSFSSIWPLTLAAAVVSAIPGVFLGLQLSQSRTGGSQAVLAMMKGPSYWLTSAVMVLIYLAFYGALISALDAFAERGNTSLGEALGTGLKLLPRMVAVSLLVAIILMIGFVLLIIPGIYLWGIYQLAFVALVVERCGVLQSLGISRRLIKGYWWRSAVIITIAVVILIVFSLIGSLANGVAIAVFGFNAFATVLDQSIIGAVLNVFLFPLLPCFLLSMYYDLKLRHEGGDLSARVDALAAH